MDNKCYYWIKRWDQSYTCNGHWKIAAILLFAFWYYFIHLFEIVCNISEEEGLLFMFYFLSISALFNVLLFVLYL